MNTTTNAAAAAQAVPPDAQLLQLATGAFAAQLTYISAKLGIADLLANGPRSIEFLAVATSTHEPSLYRLMRAASSIGLFEELDDEEFRNTPMADSLRADHPRSTRDITIWMNEEEHWRVYGHMIHSVRTGEPAFDRVHGEPVFDYLFNTNKPLGEIFNRAMTSYSHQSIAPVLEAYDISGARVIADIAGGYGHLLAAMLRTNSQAKGILFDIPQVLQGAPRMMEKYGVGDRVQLVEGDFFSEVGVEADLYVLKHIIHDWDDERSIKILSNIRTRMPEGARIAIIDSVLSERNAPDLGKLIDLEMLLVTGGTERTADEFDALLKNAGLRMTRIVPTKGPVSVVEAVKA